MTRLSRLFSVMALAVIGYAVPATAQVATTYTFSQSAGTYVPLVGGTQLAQNANLDENVYPVSIPTFYFDGTSYQSIFVSTNGFITFGSYMPDIYFYNPLSSADPYDGCVSAFGGDVAAAQAAAGTRNLTYGMQGNDFVVQWQNVRRYQIAGERVSFQIRLNTVTNQINIVYGGSLIPGNDQVYPEIGLRGPDNTFATNVNNRSVVAATGAWINSTAGATNTSTCMYDSNNPTVVPAVGTTFTWTPAPIDMLVSSLVSPGLSGCYGRNETVSVQIKNIGGAVINFATTPVTINASATGTNPVIFTPVVVNTGTLAIGASQTVVITTTYDMSVAGSYVFDASTSVIGDSHVSNDGMASVTRESHTPEVIASSDVAICDGSMTTLGTTATAFNYDATFTNNTPLAIPDDTPAGVNSTIVVSGQPVPASSVSVRIENLMHTYDADLTITLTAPDGSVIILALEPGVGDDNFTNTLFTATATTPISMGIEPFTGPHLPEEPFSNLTGLANGTWTLHIEDNYADDAGTLFSWSILIPVANSVSTYAWTPAGSLSSATVSNPDATPASTTTYTVVVTDASGCTNSDEVTVTVNPIPAVVANSTASTVCDGSPVTLTGGGATSYTWTSSVTDGVAFNPSATDTYTVTGTDANGCTNTDMITVTVNPAPPVVANTTASAVCDGSSVTLTGSGATSYSWTSSVTDGVAFTPVATDTYTVTGTDANGCTNTDVITVTVNTAPTVVANSTASAVCDGSPVTLTGSGATSYTWTGSVTDGVAFTPVATDTYTVTGTDANGCTNTDLITVTVNTLPTVAANSTSSAVCDGSPVTLTGSGATSYTWTSSVTDGVAFTPVVTDTYTVTGTDGNGCTATDAITVTVNALPVVTVSLPIDTLCLNDPLFTLTGETPVGGTWSGPGVTGNTFDPMAAGLGIATIVYMYTDANSCSASDSAEIVVDVCTGIVDAAGFNASVYPNPTTGMFTIQLSETPAEGASVEVLNSLGQVVDAFTMTATTKQVDLSAMEGGLYTVRIISGNVVMTQRIVKQ